MRLETRPFNLHKYSEYLDNVIASLPPAWSKICRSLPDEYMNAWGGTERHHAYSGGLLVHVAEVVRGVELMQGHYSAFVAALWHDWGKLLEYDSDGKPTEYRKLIGHVTGSVLELQKRFNGTELEFHRRTGDVRMEDEIFHAMLAHHGRYEWKSPVLPNTDTAFILHAADMMSANHGRIRLDSIPTPMLQF